MGSHSSGKMFIALVALLVGTTGCASGGGGGSSSGDDGLDVDALMAEARDIEQGEPPRETANTQAAEEYLDAAEDANDAGAAEQQYRLALNSAEAAIAEDPRNPLAHRLAGLAHLGLGDYLSAGAAFDEAQELRPISEFEDVGIREQAYIDEYQAASPYLGTGEYEQAAIHLENADAIYHGRPEAKITLAQIYAASREHDLALQKIDEIEEFMASDAMADIDEEMAANWREQVVGFPLMKAQILADAGRFEESVVEYRALVAANPDDIALRRDLASILMQMGSTAEAVEIYSDLAMRTGLSSEDLSIIGLGFYQADEYERAAETLERAAEVSPMDRDAIEWWARSLLADSAYAEVTPVTQRWIELDPQSQQAYAIQAQAANMNGDTQLAAQTIQTLQDLEFSVDNLQMRRTAPGGAEVTGAVQNKTLAPGTQVTLVFTFFAESGAPLGEVIHTVAVGAENMNELFQLVFDSAEFVGGYGYEVGG